MRRSGVRFARPGLFRRIRTVAARFRAGLPAGDAFLLLPAFPESAAVVGRNPRWRAALEHWGLSDAPAPGGDLVLGDPGAAAATGAPLVLVRGADDRRRLRGAGYAVRTYRVRWLTRHVVVASADPEGFALARRTWAAAGRSWPWRLQALLAPSALTVGARGVDPAPALTARGPWGCLAVDVRDPRRRAVALVPAAGDRPASILKLGRMPGADERAEREQRALALLPDDGTTPRPLGCGRVGPVEWSAETVVRGRPIRDLPRDADALPVLTRVATWLGDVAVATARPCTWTSLTDAVALRGPATELAVLLPRLDGVPAVLAHGDLASGHNLLVGEDGRPAVIDWETARERSLPLSDLLPVLCLALARARVGHDPEAQAAQVLALGQGRHPDSPWLFDRIGAYAARLDLPAPALGALALLAWGHLASMRLVREELLAAPAASTQPRSSVGERVLARWLDEVGPDWPQLHSRLNPDDGPP